MLVFLAFPVVFALYMSFHEWDVLTDPTWIGLDNYVYLFTEDDLFWTSLRNSTYYVLLTVVPSIGLGLAMAMAMNQAIRGIMLFRAALYVPVLTSAVAVAFIWKWIFNADVGILNKSLMIVFNLTCRDEAKRQVFQNKGFRVNFSHAINRQAIIDTVYVPQGQPWQAAPRQESDLQRAIAHAIHGSTTSI